MNIQQRIRQITLILSICLFVLSLTQICFCTSNDCIGSVFALTWGLIALFLGGAGLTWIANPILVTIWIMMIQNSRHNKLLMFGSILATILSASFLLFHGIAIDEGGMEKEILSYKAGYWLWLTSSLVLLIGNLTIYLLEYKNTKINAS